jgi:outer membrane protein assembly factor BamB
MKTYSTLTILLVFISLASCTKIIDKTSQSSMDGATDALKVADKRSKPVLITNSKTEFAVIDALAGEEIRRKEKYDESYQISQAPLIVGNQMILPLGNIIRSVDLTTQQTVWQTSLSHAAQAIHVTSPLCTDGTHIFVTLAQSNKNTGNLNYHKFFALNAANGNIDWVNDVTTKYVIGIANSELRAPVSSDKKVFVPLNDTMYAFDVITGKEIWRFVSASGAEEVFNPEVENGIIYFTTTAPYNSSYRDSLYALDAQTGKPLWTKDVQDYELPEVNAVVAEQGQVYLNFNKGILCMDATNGTTKWFTNLLPVFGGFTPVFVFGNSVITTASGGTGSLIVYALNATNGNILWQTTRKPPVSSNVLNRGASVMNDIVYVRSIDSYTTAFDLQTGKFLWENYLPSFSTIFSPVLIDCNGKPAYAAVTGMY